MHYLKLIKNYISHPETYYFVNQYKTVSKAKWKDKKIDYKREEDGNYFLDYQDAFESIK